MKWHYPSTLFSAFLFFPFAIVIFRVMPFSRYLFSSRMMWPKHLNLVLLTSASKLLLPRVFKHRLQASTFAREHLHRRDADIRHQMSPRYCLVVMPPPPYEENDRLLSTISWHTDAAKQIAQGPTAVQCLNHVQYVKLCSYSTSAARQANGHTALSSVSPPRTALNPQPALQRSNNRRWLEFFEAASGTGAICSCEAWASK